VANVGAGQVLTTQPPVVEAFVVPKEFSQRSMTVSDAKPVNRAEPNAPEKSQEDCWNQEEETNGPVNGGKWKGNTFVNDAGEPMGYCRGY